MQYSLATVRLGSRLPGRSVVYRSCYKELFLLLPTSERPLCGSEQLYWDRTESVWSKKAVSVRGCGSWAPRLVFGLPSAHSGVSKWQIPVHLFFQSWEDLTATPALNRGHSGLHGQLTDRLGTHSVVVNRLWSQHGWERGYWWDSGKTDEQMLPCLFFFCVSFLITHIPSMRKSTSLINLVYVSAS